MSHMAYIAYRVEIMEFLCILKVVRSAVFVVTCTGNLIIFTPTVSYTMVGYSLCFSTSDTMCEYVTMRPTGILLRATKRIALVPFHFS